ncbi:uncharacterized protein LOC120168280 [Hibiscus syriacus]|uniref:uncharacterized protein LOC120168280 n=1 Tax=Hibiscus syriacus TaxID=106335 RepID=UPI00192364F4|nr:uncharacterized protein LOC120168280 [Hibiscus syriacus]
MDWKKLFKFSESQDLEYFPPNVRDGTPFVLPSPEIIEAGISEWRLSLVGQFLGATPSFASLQRIVDSLWSKTLGGSRVQVSYAGNNLFIFSFDSESARDWVLVNGPWHVQNKTLILRKWEPSFKSFSFNLTKILVWVHLFNVPLELFSRVGLSYIASAIGIPLSMDNIIALKSRLEFAKVYVEIGVNDTIPKFIDVAIKDGQKTSIYVEVPWLPPSCKKCKVFGHNEKGYQHKPNATPAVAQVWKKKGETVANSAVILVGGVETLQEPACNDGIEAKDNIQ